MSLWRNFLRWAGTKMIIAANNYHKLSDHSYLETLILQWETSPFRKMQMDGERYYVGDHDILHKKRTIIGENGELVEVKNLPNNRIVDNQVAKMIDQKNNYLLGKPITFTCDDDAYIEQLNTVFNRRWNKRLKDLGHHAITGGIAWLHPYVEDGKMQFKVFPAHQILPIWLDAEHEKIAMGIRLYLEEKKDPKFPGDYTKKVEIYKPDGIEYYIFDNNRLEPDLNKPKASYLTVKQGDSEQNLNWERIPLIPFKFNAKEIPIIKRCKSQQDAINHLESMYKDHMEEDIRNTIIVLKAYDGENLSEFRQKLAQYGAIKVRSDDSAKGDVSTLHIEVNAANYESILKLFKESLIENCRGFDFSELKSGSPNQMNIKSILSEIDMDANDMQTEFEVGLEDLLWFVNNFLGITEEKQVDIVFNRDTIVNETEVIASMVSLGVEVSNETKLKQLPFVDDPEEEQKRVDKQKEKELDAYAGALPMGGAPAPGKPVKDGKTNDKPKQ